MPAELDISAFINQESSISTYQLAKIALRQLGAQGRARSDQHKRITIIRCDNAKEEYNLPLIMEHSAAIHEFADHVQFIAACEYCDQRADIPE